MANIEHKDLPNAQLHEVKGVSAASDDQILKAVSGQGVWSDADSLPGLQLPPVFSMTADVVVDTTVTETSLTAAGSGSLTLGANSMSVGEVIRFRMRGIFSNTGTPTIRIRVKLGSVIVLDTLAITTTTAASDNEWSIEGDIVVRTIGGSGTVMSSGRYETDNDDRAGMINLSTVVIDTTASQAFDITVEWGTSDVSNTITSQILSLERRPQ